MPDRSELYRALDYAEKRRDEASAAYDEAIKKAAPFQKRCNSAYLALKDAEDTLDFAVRALKDSLPANTPTDPQAGDDDA